MTGLWNSLFAIIVWCLVSHAHPQAYPTKAVTLVVPFAPGGSVDYAGRMLVEPMARQLGQPFIVENRGGAGGNIGHAVVARAPKDGYTVLVGYSATNACSPSLFANLGWEPLRDFAPVGMMGVTSLVIAVHPSVPARTLAEFIAYAKANPGKINYGSSGIGSQAHIAAELFQQRTGTRMVHIPFKGAGDLMPSLLGGNIQMAVATQPATLQHVQAGKLRALAVLGMTRDAAMPEVPTAHEQGVTEFEVEGWIGLFVPNGTSQTVIARLADALKRTIETDEFRQRGTAAGLVTGYLGPEAMAAKVRKDIEVCSAAVRGAGIKLD